MPNYRRNRVPGGTYFFTMTLADRRSDLLVREINALREAIRSVRRERPFIIDAWVVLPEHLHCIWILPEDDADFPARWQAIKAAFSRALPRACGANIALRPGERGIWQRRYWEHTIRDERDYRTHVNYIHFNPVKHGLVDAAQDWSYSPFRRSVARGLYPPDWANPGDAPIETGERDDT